jgi:uncharacterized protein (DUF4415 family)
MRKRNADGYEKTPREVADALGVAERIADFLPSPEELKKEIKKPVTLRLDPDVIEWFRRTGRGYQTRMNAVLRAYMKAKENAGRTVR